MQWVQMRQMGQMGQMGHLVGQLNQSPSVWGSKLWEVLHAIGSRSGRSPAKLQRDELRELQWIVDNLETIIPCKECRTHVEEYRKLTPPPEIWASDYDSWFWNFHEAVNTRLGKVGVSFEEYKLQNKQKVIESWKEFARVVKIPATPLKGFERHLRLWMGFAGI